VTSNVVVPEDLAEEIISEESADFAKISGCRDTGAAMRGMLSATHGLYDLTAPFLERFANPKVLELGSGNGLNLCDLLKRGLDAYGIEPGEAPFDGRFTRAVKLLEANGIDDAKTRLLSAVAEDLPFPDATFDLVVSNAVIEHVRDVKKAFAEAVRVTKPGGILVMQMPNYDSFYEGHYRIPWLPYALRTKSAARVWVGKVWKRPIDFLDTLNFTTPSKLKALADAHRDVKRSEIFYTSFGKLTYVPALHRALALGLDRKLGPAAPIARAPVVGGAIRAGSYAATRFLAALGMSPEFTVVCHKA
jgi:SAM-dependent methyltransferase